MNCDHIRMRAYLLHAGFSSLIVINRIHCPRNPGKRGEIERSSHAISQSKERHSQALHAGDHHWALDLFSLGAAAGAEGVFEMPSLQRFAVLSALGLSLALLSGPAFADVVKYKADLSGPDENPATTSKGTGAIEASYDSTTKMLTWSGTYSGLTGPETAAHFHGPAPVGTNAGVMVPVDAKTSPFKGSATLSDDQAKSFAGGLVYFNIHTAQNKGGEIRGQMAPEK